ncbi:MAG: hypothetical protein HZC25_08165 [Rhodospirillales bacterium]|nr:hypothetical protein [Rhodospirillales bacterium]
MEGGLNFFSVTVIVFILALIGVFAMALIMYLSSLVKSAYQIRIEMRADLDEGLKRIDDELNKKGRWLKRDLLEEVDKIRANTIADFARRQSELYEEIRKLIAGVDAALRQDMSGMGENVKNLLDQAHALDHRVKGIRRDLQHVMDARSGTPSVPAGDPAGVVDSIGDGTVPPKKAP